jgi:hypothetical protein
MVLELAVTAECDYIITYNKRDFGGAERFDIQVVTPSVYYAGHSRKDSHLEHDELFRRKS